jgi:DNA-binding transcriptional LysR family regulator
MEGAMRLEWMEDILAILRAGSLSAAAEVRHVSQPAFSRRIRQIEEHVGVDLLDRSSRPARLRPSILAQSQVLQDLSERMHELLYDLRRHDQRNANRFVIASQHAIATTMVPRLIERLAAEIEVNVHVRSGNRDECFEFLVRRQADLLIVYRTGRELGAEPEPFIEERLLGHEDIVPVFAAAGMRGLRRQIGNGELPLIVYPSDVFFGEVMDHELLPDLRSGFLLRPKAETALTLTALQLAIAGVGVAWVPVSLAAREIAAGVLARVPGTLAQVTLSMHAMRLTGPRPALSERVWSMLDRIASA